MGLLPDTYNCGLRMLRECREHYSHHGFQRKPLVIDPGMHDRTCVTHVPWCMSGSLTPGGRENVPIIPCTFATLYFRYLARGPFNKCLCRRVGKWNLTYVHRGPFLDVVQHVEVWHIRVSKYNCTYFADNYLHCIILNEKLCSLFQIWFKCQREN